MGTLIAFRGEVRSQVVSETDEVKKALEIIESYLRVRSRHTDRSYRSIIRKWVKYCIAETYFPERFFLRAKPSDAINYYEWCLNREGLKPRDGGSSKVLQGTVNREMLVLRQMYSWLIDNKITSPPNPFVMALPKTPSGECKRPTEGLSAEQVRAIFNIAGSATALRRTRKAAVPYRAAMDRAILAFLFGCGLRRNEVVGVRLGQLMPEKRALIVDAQKNGNRNVLRVPDWAWEIIQEFVIMRNQAPGLTPQSLLFWRISGPKCLERPVIQGNYVNRLFRRAVKLAGLPPIYTPHAARATAITNLLELGIPHREVQEFSRHSSIQMVELYDKRRFAVEENPGRLVDYGIEKNSTLASKDNPLSEHSRLTRVK